jgi:hypothetical protein
MKKVTVKMGLENGSLFVEFANSRYWAMPEETVPEFAFRMKAEAATFFNIELEVIPA